MQITEVSMKTGVSMHTVQAHDVWLLISQDEFYSCSQEYIHVLYRYMLLPEELLESLKNNINSLTQSYD